VKKSGECEYGFLLKFDVKKQLKIPKLVKVSIFENISFDSSSKINFKINLFRYFT
jgi:hypothetical protein